MIGIVADRRFPRHKPILRIAVTFWRSFSTMHMNHGAHLRLVRLSSVDAVVDRKEMRSRQFIRPLHQQSLTAARFKRWPGRRRSVSPQASRLQVTVQFALKLPHGDAIVRQLDRRVGWARTQAVRLGDLGNRQRIDELRERTRIQLRAKPGCGAARCGLRQRGRHPNHAAIVKKFASCEAQSAGFS